MWISDAGEPGRGRRLTSLIGALEGVLREAEAEGGTDREMIERANARLDPTRYKFWDESWLGDRIPPRSRHELERWMRTNCDYWFVQDIIDLCTKGWEPRLWVPIIRSWALTRGFALHPGTRNRYEIRDTRTQHRPASRPVNDHGRVSGTHRGFGARRR